MQNGLTVTCNHNTKVFLTKETKTSSGITAVLCDLDGNTVQHGSGREIYTDSASQNKFALVTHSEAEALRGAGQDVYQGVGDVHGWFIEAPDHTVNGFHGEKSNGKKDQSN